jgi:hypothetical protein
MGFEKFHIFARNPKVLAYGFSENSSLGQKLTETPYFLVMTPVLQIGYLSRSRISIFMGFEKFHIFARNPKVLAYGFTKKCQFGAKPD